MNLLNDLQAFIPATIVAIGGLLILLAEALANKTSISYWVAVTSVAAALIKVMFELTLPATEAFGGMYIFGGANAFGAMVVLIGTLFSLLLSKDFLAAIGYDKGEVYALILFATLGMLTMVGANDMITVFIGLETMSICLYVLAGLVRENKQSNEAALKYFLLGAFSTGFLLYGIALIYGATGSTNFDVIGSSTKEGFVFWGGVSLLLVGFFFKISAVPFHMWTPDVYQGAPTTITAYMATASKSATFVTLIFVLANALNIEMVQIKEAIFWVAVATMVLGNVIAIVQDNVKRMLAYSSIAHAGYALVGIIAGTAEGYNAVLFYLFAYTLMNVGAFGVIAFYEKHKEKDFTNIENLAGIGFSQPVMAALLSMFLFSLAGIPPFVGFIGKYKVFAAAINQGEITLAIIGVLASAASAYYYLRVMVYMYFKQSKDTVSFTNPAFIYQFALILLLLFTVYFGVMPTELSKILEGFDWSSALSMN
ncbi:NADH-quinone oxidoreductase subunit N [bacterium]|nr:MAG: NADH-quinone oxidoreductase subunit N [bacterium]